MNNGAVAFDHACLSEKALLSSPLKLSTKPFQLVSQPKQPSCSKIDQSDNMCSKVNFKTKQGDKLRKQETKPYGNRTSTEQIRIWESLSAARCPLARCPPAAGSREVIPWSHRFSSTSNSSTRCRRAQCSLPRCFHNFVVRQPLKPKTLADRLHAWLNGYSVAHAVSSFFMLVLVGFLRRENAALQHHLHLAFSFLFLLASSVVCCWLSALVAVGIQFRLCLFSLFVAVPSSVAAAVVERHAWRRFV